MSSISAHPPTQIRRAPERLYNIKKKEDEQDICGEKEKEKEREKHIITKKTQY